MTPREFENEPASAVPVRLTQFSAANSTGPGLQPRVPAGSAGAHCSPSLATAAAAVSAAAAAVSSFVSFTAPSLGKERLSTQPATAAAGPPSARRCGSARRWSRSARRRCWSARRRRRLRIYRRRRFNHPSRVQSSGGHLTRVNMTQ